ncbi:MAG: hypothetical protein EBT06_04775 [Gammaproteobacteria bacterium]|jgi:hypothetical protein|nr:hypothetical protein [Gammaproteobacteria bacterium]NBT44228.1 hypothetical protein [Gammaproteobacteria bacterium]NBY22050.1 hypothetical protein [Gammaproteobacteria bacterium]NDG87531.1 hypothetical protein [Gammaproteobacteria bacterium]
MSEDKFSAYTQQLLDTSVSLRKEIDNLREAYTLVNERLRAIAALADKTNKVVLQEAIDVEELAALAVLASKVSDDAASLLDVPPLRDATGKTVQAATAAHDLASQSKNASAVRQTSGGMPYPG